MPIVKASNIRILNPFLFGGTALQPSGSVVAHNQGISLGGSTSVVGDDTWGRHLQVGLTKNNTEGNSNTPCLELSQKAMWRFRWVVKPGQRRIAVYVKQVKTFDGQRPTMTIKKNQDVGILSDIVTVAPNGSDWVVIGPTIFTATSTGIVFVELRNNLNMYECPVNESRALFDHIVVT